MSTTRGDILWQPTQAQIDGNLMTAFERWLGTERGLSFADHNALWEWSVTDLEGFWSAIWAFFEIRSTTPPERFLARDAQPGAEWCPGCTLNHADVILRHAETKPDEVALVVQSETHGRTALTWGELRGQVSSLAHHLASIGVGQGDRVTAILPNSDASIIAYLATVSLGAIWSICAPDMGHVAILDRFRQIEPKVLIYQDGYVHAGALVDRRDAMAEIRAGLPSLAAEVILPVAGAPAEGQLVWADLLSAEALFAPRAVPFDHPLWIVYSSGTTGTPKPIVHGHGGIILEATKQALHHDLRAGDRFSWLTSSGWIMWNVQLLALSHGARVAIFDGAPNHPDMSVVWRFVAEEQLTMFGAGAAFFDGCRKAGVVAKDLDLSALRCLGSTGSPLSADGYDWVYRDVKPDVWLAPISGGTDIAGAFVLGHPSLPVRAGEMQARSLGCATASFDEAGKPLIGAVGELVCARPLPSMPLYFWGDADGSRLHDSYYDTYPGIWRHGDWIEIFEDGASVIYGRSDATINRKGLRLGSSEIYRAVEALPEVLDSLVVDLEYLGRESFMPLFVVPQEGHTLGDALRARITEAIRTSVSPRFVPNEIVEVAEIPRTLSGKKLEVPVKKLLLGGDAATVVNRDSMANPHCFDTFIAYAAARAEAGPERETSKG